MQCQKEFNFEDEIHLEINLVKNVGLNMNKFNNHVSVTNKYSHGVVYSTIPLKRQGTLASYWKCGLVGALHLSIPYSKKTCICITHMKVISFLKMFE